MFLGLPGGPEVPAPQAGIQTPHPDGMVFDSNVPASIQVAWQVLDQDGHWEGIRANTELWALRTSPAQLHPGDK